MAKPIFVIRAYPDDGTVDYRLKTYEDMRPYRSEPLRPFVMVDRGAKGQIIGVTLHGKPAATAMTKGFGVELLDAFSSDLAEMNTAVDGYSGDPENPESWRALNHDEIKEAQKSLGPVIDWLRALWPAAT